MRRTLILLVALLMLGTALAACSSDGNSQAASSTLVAEATATPENDAAATEPANESAAATSEESATEATGVATSDETQATAGDIATVDGTTITLGDTIAIDGDGASVSDAGVLITQSGTYVVSGTLTDGMIEVNAPDAAVEIVLNGANLTNADGPAIYVVAASDAIITLADGSTNTLQDGGSSELDAVVYAEVSLTIRGDGQLQVNGTVKEGIASTMHITIEGGYLHLNTVEDGINANNDGVSIITITGGYVYTEPQDGDGIDSNGDLYISGGTVVALGYGANAGIDADGAVVVSGGTLIATGSMLEKPSADSALASLLVQFTGDLPAGTLVSIQDGETAILTVAPALSFNRLLYVSDQVSTDVTYRVLTGGTASGEAVDGVYPSGTITGGSEVATVTTESAPMGGPGR